MYIPMSLDDVPLLVVCPTPSMAWLFLPKHFIIFSTLSTHVKYPPQDTATGVKPSPNCTASMAFPCLMHISCVNEYQKSSMKRHVPLLLPLICQYLRSVRCLIDHVHHFRNISAHLSSRWRRHVPSRGRSNRRRSCFRDPPE